MSNSPDLQEHSKHLRSVHFWLVTVCFGLLATSLMGKGGEIENAIRHLREIMNVADRWAQDPAWIETYASKHINSKFHPDTVDLRSFFVPYFQYRFSLEGPIRTDPRQADPENWTSHVLGKAWWTLRDQRTFAFEIIHPDKQGWREIRVKSPETLSEFSHLWTDLDCPLNVYIPSSLPTSVLRGDKLLHLSRCPTAPLQEGCRQIEGEIVPTIMVIEALKETKNVETRVLSPYRPEWLAKRQQANMKDFSYTHGFFLEWEPGIRFPGSPPTWSESFPVPVKVASTIDAQFALNETFGTTWDMGPYQHTFPELSSITQNYQDLPFRKIYAILDSERSRTGERFEIFGTKIPTGELAKWAIPVVLALQIYLWLHLTYFLSIIRPEDEGAHAPWIALYPGGVPKTLTALSACVFPLVVTAVVTTPRMSGSDNGWAWPWWAVATVLSALLALLSLKALMSLWARTQVKAETQNRQDEMG